MQASHARPEYLTFCFNVQAMRNALVAQGSGGSLVAVDSTVLVSSCGVLRMMQEQACGSPCGVVGERASVGGFFNVSPDYACPWMLYHVPSPTPHRCRF